MADEVCDLDEARHSPHVAQKRRVRIRGILRAALEIAGQEGRDALTLKRLAERLGLTTAALYRYFSSKDALVAELQRAVISALSDATLECVNTADVFADRSALPAGERALLAVVVSAFVFEEFSRSAPVEFGILSMDLSSPESTLPDREAAHVLEAAWSALSDLARRLQSAQECGALEPGDASERAVALWASLQGVAQSRKLARSASSPIDSNRIARGLVSALLVGWGAEPETASRVVELTRRERFAQSPKTAHDYLDKLGEAVLS
jgi:AcrR family transcriptional regulator